MSSAIAYAHSDSYKLPAGILTLVAHTVFFALLYLGINWQAQPPQGMVVELWSDLPELNAPPAPSPPPAAPPEQPPAVEVPVKPEAAKPQPEQVTGKAEIELAGKKKKKAPQAEAKPEPKMSKAELRKAKSEMLESIRQQEQAEQAERQARAKQAAEAAEAAAAITSEMGKYKGLIISKVRRNVVLPPDVADDAQAEFDVTLLPGGEVFEVTKTRKSGNAAYDNAVERAIWKASPLPVPSDAELFSKNFRNLHLKFKPKD